MCVRCVCEVCMCVCEVCARCVCQVCVSVSGVCVCVCFNGFGMDGYACRLLVCYY